MKAAILIVAALSALLQGCPKRELSRADKSCRVACWKSGDYCYNKCVHIYRDYGVFPWEVEK